MTDTDALVEFLRARIAETRAAAAELTASDWPAFLIEKCDAERGIVNVCTEVLAAGGGDAPALAEQVLLLLAVPWATHPDYNEDWRL